MSEEVKRDLAWKIVLWGLAVFVSISTSLFAYVVTNIHALDIRVTTIESNRFTTRDSSHLLSEVATLRARVDSIPLIRERVEHLKTRITELEANKHKARTVSP